MDLSYLINTEGQVGKVAQAYYTKRRQRTEQTIHPEVVFVQFHVPIFLTHVCTKQEELKNVDRFYGLLVDELLELTDVDLLEQGFSEHHPVRRMIMRDEIVKFAELFVRSQSPLNECFDNGCIYAVDPNKPVEDAVVIFIHCSRWTGPVHELGFTNNSLWSVTAVHAKNSPEPDPIPRKGVHVYYGETTNIPKGTTYPSLYQDE